MNKIVIITLLVIGLYLPSLATHQRAGEITYRYISGLTYEITIVTYSYAPSEADRCQLPIQWGDGTTSTLYRSNGPLGINPSLDTCNMGEMVGLDIKKNLYIGQHTFPGPATYKVSLEDPNRNYGIQNIPSSVDIPLYIETLITVNPFVGPDNSPQLLLPPIDQGCTNQLFLHNPGAYDPDGDSLSYSLTVCRGAGGEIIPGYILPNEVDPNHTGIFIMDPVTGNLTWDKPTLQGEYNIAFLIEEWRNGVKIGYITRDMQITIVSCVNKPPVIQTLLDTCITAGDTLSFLVTATDEDMNKIILTAKGQPFFMDPNPANFVIRKDTFGRIIGEFNWITDCSQIKKTPYQVFFKAVDQGIDVNLFDIKSMFITIVGPKTENLGAEALGNTVKLTWSPNPCQNAVKYKLYRRTGSNNFQPGHCETGIPPGKGYSFIGEVPSSSLTYLDGNSSPGLVHGIEYCYRIVAVYPDGAESYVSDEVCIRLKKDVPVITHVSILKTSGIDGKVYLAWSKPTEIDGVQAPGPYKYLIYRSLDLTGSSLQLIDSLNSLNDTIYYDEPVNTRDQALSYRVDVINNTPGNRFLIGPSEVASSLFITFEPGDQKLRINFNFQVPWVDTLFTVKRLNELTQVFEAIGTTTSYYYIDHSLTNGKNYCYLVESVGTYRTNGITHPLINLSQEACSVPYDNEPPCPPVLSVKPDCNNSNNILDWEYPDDTCSKDVLYYYIYYRPPLSQNFSLVDSVSVLYNSYIHRNLITIAGCYAVRAIDSTGNYSTMSDTLCLNSDTCSFYHLPNFFTPNGDTFNDYLVPFPFTSVEKIDLEIFNRWGNIVFSTEDPNINWDGKIMGTNQEASDGVYYYVCDVYLITLGGEIKKTIKGSVTILR